MKKHYIITIILLFISIISINAQSYENKKIDLKYDFSANLGYNVAYNGVIFGAKIGFEFLFLRADVDISGNYLDYSLNLENFTTFSPAIGFFYGKFYKVYALIGFQNYALIQHSVINGSQKDYFRSDHIYGITKVGYQHTIDGRFFLSFEAHYLFCKQKSVNTYFPNTNIRIGVGFRF